MLRSRYINHQDRQVPVAQAEQYAIDKRRIEQVVAASYAQNAVVITPVEGTPLSQMSAKQVAVIIERDCEQLVRLVTTLGWRNIAIDTHDSNYVHHPVHGFGVVCLELSRPDSLIKVDDARRDLGSLAFSLLLISEESDDSPEMKGGALRLNRALPQRF